MSERSERSVLLGIVKSVCTITPECFEGFCSYLTHMFLCSYSVMTWKMCFIPFTVSTSTNKNYHLKSIKLKYAYKNKYQLKFGFYLIELKM